MFYVGYIFYILIWVFGGIYMWFLVDLMGYTSAIDDYFGIAFLNYYIVIKCILLFVPLIRFFIKNEKKRKRILPFCWVATILVSILILCLDLFCINKFRIFERELWQQYPRQRNVMREDLENSNLLEGMTMEEVKAFLGEPDCVFDEALGYYTWVESDYVIIKFKDNIYESTDYWF